jgi:hypothetical protein
MIRPYRSSLALLGLLVSLSPAAMAQDGFGTIKGKLVWKGSTVPKLPLLIKKGDSSQKDAAVCAVGDLADRSLTIDPATKGVQYAFVYLSRPSGKNAAAEKAVAAEMPEVVIDQKNCEFLPYAAAIHQDQKLIFKSSDPVIHNVRYTGFNNPAQNITLAANGQFATQLKAERRPLPLKCDVHPWMSGWVMVFDHPFFAVTDAEGNFEIKGVPPGEQKIVVWQEKVGYVTAGGAGGTAVTVKAGETTTMPAVELDPAKVKNLPK